MTRGKTRSKKGMTKLNQQKMGNAWELPHHCRC